MQNIVFMGTPDFAIPSLEALINDDNYQVMAVVTQPDRPVGRKHQLQASPVKETALENHIPVFQPEKIAKDEEFKEFLATHDVDFLITAAYGQYIPDSILHAVNRTALNVHASLLPKYRGGAPVHYAIWHGDKETGVTIMEMVKKMDAGGIYAQSSLPIEDQDTVSSMFEKLSHLGADLLMTTLPKIISGELTPTPQDESKATYSPNITSEQERINWHQTASEIHNQVRAFNSWPVAHAIKDGKRWKIWSTEVMEDQKTTETPGTIIRIQKKPARFEVACGEGTVLNITEIQPAGKKRMAIRDFINGGAGHTKEGDHFDDPSQDNG